MAKPLTAAVTGLASTFLSSVPAATQPAHQAHHPPPAAGPPAQSAAPTAVPPSHPATMGAPSSLPHSTINNNNATTTTTTMGPNATVPPQAQPGGAPSNRQSAAYEDLAVLRDEEFPLDEEEMMDTDTRTPPTRLEEDLEGMEERLEDSRPPTPCEEMEIIPER